MSQSSNNAALASVVVLVVFALTVAWYINTRPLPAQSSEGTPSSTPQEGQLQGTVR
ncbi:MAG: hypothetical protein AAB919_01885 [Patescibacteria group bacterium]